MTRIQRSCALLISSPRFPGSQPVSFGVHDLDKLENQECVLCQCHPLNLIDNPPARPLSFWVCEKSDGIRVLFLIVTDSETRAQNIFLVSFLLVVFMELFQWPLNYLIDRPPQYLSSSRRVLLSSLRQPQDALGQYAD